MIEVIGKDTEKIRKVTCPNCCSILKFTNADTQRGHETDYTGGRDDFDELICPECKNKIRVSLF
jgi:RNase P subunit RPR2